VRVLYIELSDGKKQCRLCGKVPKPNGTGGNTNWARHIRGKRHLEYHAAFADYTKGEATMKDFYNVRRRFWIFSTRFPSLEVEVDENQTGSSNGTSSHFSNTHR
jgi:hypothetical protein